MASEYARITQNWMEDTGMKGTFVRSWGATEVLPPEDADVIVDNTATGFYPSSESPPNRRNPDDVLHSALCEPALPGKTRGEGTGGDPGPGSGVRSECTEAVHGGTQCGQ